MLYQLLPRLIVVIIVIPLIASLRNKKSKRVPNKQPASNAQSPTIEPFDITELYRKLAHKYHPDKGQDPIRDKIMARINRAYKEKDIETLKSFIID